MRKVNLAEAFATFSDTWHPRIVGELNDFHVKAVKLELKTIVNTGAEGGERTVEPQWI